MFIKIFYSTMADYKWYYENVRSDTWNPFEDDYCEILNDFHSRNVKSGILYKKTNNQS
jgi:hypothetical protein